MLTWMGYLTKLIFIIINFYIIGVFIRNELVDRDRSVQVIII